MNIEIHGSGENNYGETSELEWTRTTHSSACTSSGVAHSDSRRLHPLIMQPMGGAGLSASRIVNTNYIPVKSASPIPQVMAKYFIGMSIDSVQFCFFVGSRISFSKQLLRNFPIN